MANYTGKTFLITAFILFGSHTFAQQKNSTFVIVNNRDTVGAMQLAQNKTGDKLEVKLTSAVQTKGFMSVKVQTEETSHYDGGKLISSAVKRTVNGNEKLPKTTVFSAAGYIASSDSGEKNITKLPITFNVCMLYVKEPAGITQLYSDNFQQYVPVEEVSKHAYKISLPDKNYTTYYYTNGICTSIDVHNGLYNLQMLLKK